MKLFVRVSAAVAALVLVAACSESPVGPAASRTDSTTTVRTVPDAPSLAVAPAPTTYTVATCVGGTIVLSADEKRSLDLHNAQRTANALTPFCVDSVLTIAARAHSSEMLAKSYFSHNSYNGESFAVRLQNFGYKPFRALAENIAWGSGSYGTPDAIFTSWMNSAGHKANILNGSLKQIGIGVAAGTFQGYAGARIYTADFGTR